MGMRISLTIYSLNLRAKRIEKLLEQLLNSSHIEVGEDFLETKDFVFPLRVN